MDEMSRGMSGSTSGSIKTFFLKCLVPVVIGDYGLDGGGDALLFELLCYILAPYFLFFYHVPCYVILFTSPSAYHYCLSYLIHLPYKPLYKA
jgi:hypothetical protein